MARAWFGGTSDDWMMGTVAAFGATLVTLNAVPVTGTCWDAETGGNQITDLLDANGVAMTVLTVTGSQLPRFQGPDGVVEIWVDFGAGRILLQARDQASAAAAASAEAQAARDQAQGSADAAATSETNAAASAAAAEAVGDTNDTIMAGVVDNPASATSVALGGVIAGRFGLIDVGARGVSATNSASSNAALIQAAVADAEAAGTGLLFPATDPGAPITVDTHISITQGGIRIIGSHTHIEQQTYPHPVFEISGPGVLVEGFVFTNVAGWSATAIDPASGLPFTSASWRGETKQSWSCGVWIGADDCTVRHITAATIYSAVRANCWDIATDSPGSALLSNITVEDVSVSDVCMGVCPKGVTDFTFRNVRGSYGQVYGTSTPPHLIYFSIPGSATSIAGVMNANVAGSDCVAFDGTDAHAYQFKWIAGGAVSNLVARDCTGLVNAAGLQDFLLRGLVGEDLTWSATTGAITLAVDTGLGCIRTTIEDVRINLVGDGRVITVDSGSSDCLLKRIQARSSHTSTQAGATSADVQVNGTRITLEDVSVDNVGATYWGAGIALLSGDGHRVINPACTGNRCGVDIENSATNAVLVVDEERLVPAPASPLWPIQTASSASPVIYRRAKRPLGTNRVLISDEFLDRQGSPTSPGVGALGLTTTGGKRWTTPVGTWRSTGSKASQVSSNDGQATVDAGQANVEIEVGITYSNRGGVLLRWLSSTDWLSVRLNHVSGTVELTKGGTAYTQLASAAFAPTVGRRYSLRVQAYGPDVRVFVDGVAMFAFTLTGTDATTYASSTLVGLLAQANADLFDNFTVRSLT